MRPKHVAHSYTNSYNSAMTVIAQDNHLTAGAWAACAPAAVSCTESSSS